MTVDRWLAERTPAPPAALAARLRTLAALGTRGADQEPVGEALLDAAEEVLTRLLREGCATRQSALDLLVADALVTYAFESATTEPKHLAARAEQAMVRIAALADTEVDGAPRRAGARGEPA